MKKEKIKSLLNEFKDITEEEKEDIILMLNANKLVYAIHAIQQEVFRPARKYGYEDSEIRFAIEKCGITKGEDEYNEEHHGADLIGLLESKFIDVLRDNEVLDLCL